MVLKPSMAEIELALRRFVQQASGLAADRVFREDQSANPPLIVNPQSATFCTVGEALSTEYGLPKQWRDTQGVQISYDGRYDISFYGGASLEVARTFQVNAWREDHRRTLLRTGIMLLRTSQPQRLGSPDPQSGGAVRLPDVIVEIEVSYEQVDDGAAAQIKFDENSNLLLNVTIDKLE